MGQKKWRQVWLFCRVIDNFGDAGVVWRLAQNMRAHFAVDVHVWVDDVAVLQMLLPQNAHDDLAVHLHQWQTDADTARQIAALAPVDAVVELFGCELPKPVLERIRADRPMWLNWEYLSAEPWASQWHGLPSLQGDGVHKYFWLMGFDEHSGGLLREADYRHRQTCFMADKDAQAAFRQRHGLLYDETGHTVLLFGYEQGPWASWLAMWQANGTPLTIWLAGGQVINGLRRAGVLPEGALDAKGAVWQAGCVRLQRIEFVPQDDFDALLWLADWLLVRGEDSFVRAQYAGKPFFWHIYAQEAAAHVSKLHAFWQQVYTHKAMLPSWCSAHQALSDELNAVRVLCADERMAAWQQLMASFSHWHHDATQWTHFLFQQPDAMEKLASFIKDKLK